MEKMVKQCVGIDCSKDELVVCFSQLTSEWNVKDKSTRIFSNTLTGFKQLVKWTNKLADTTIPLIFVVEATGVYHEKMAYYLFDAKQKVSIVLPNKARHFAQTLKIRTVNDRTSSKMLATLGLEKQLDAWQKPEPVFAYLKQLTREREQLLNECTVNKNQLHAEEHGAEPVKSSISRMKKRIGWLGKQILEIETEIKQVVSEHTDLSERIKKVCTIKGVGLITTVTVVAEANGFNLIRNSKQLASYAGYDVVEKQSGTSVRGKSRISGKGNKHIRRALHFPALTVVKYDKHLNDIYTRLEAKHGIKMKAYTAVQRKLLVLIYTLWKKNESYDLNYQNKKSNAIKLLEQPIGAALTELDQVRS